AKEGIIKGYKDATFKPNSPIERQEISTILANLLDGELTNEEVKNILTNFDDEVDQWAKNSVAKMIDAEIMRGLSDNIIGGQLNATRAEATVMLLRFLEY